jgi:predicted Holliday junction resolvase-like endonuclease
VRCRSVVSCPQPNTHPLPQVTRVKEANRLRGKVVVKRQPELQALRAAAKERCIGEPMATGRTLGATQLVAAIATSVERLRVLAPLLSRSHAREVSENIREELGDSASKFRRDATELSRLVVGGSVSESGGVVPRLGPR